VGTPYITNVELGQLSTMKESILATLDSTVVDQAILSASVQADTYLAARYTLPLVAWGFDLREHVAAIAAFRLWSQIGYNQTADNDDIRQRYQDAIGWLESTSENRLHPSITDTVPPLAENMAVVLSNRPRGYRFRF